MINFYYDIIDKILPFSWAHYDFMKNALIAIIFTAPLLALIGTAVVSHKMAFFSDVLGHSALTGIALGVLFGAHNPFWTMLGFIVIFALAINAFKGITQSSSDTTLGVFFAVVVSLGIVILSKGGGFNKYSGYLIGDILTVSTSQITLIIAIFLLVLIYWIYFGNNLTIISVNPVLAKTRGINVALSEFSFVIILAVLVAFSIQLIGILIINSLLILPAAASRNIAKNTFTYTLFSVLISIICGISGLITSYYSGTASGATIVLFCALFYALTTIFRKYKI